VPTDNVSNFIVLNFTKVKIFKFNPNLFCKNKGDPVLKNPITDIKKNNGKRKNKPNIEKKISNKRIIDFANTT
jgi:hypothetical protein